MSDAVPRTLSVEELQPSRDDEESVPKRQCTEPTKRCGKRNAKGWHCKHRFPASDPCSTCPTCRKSGRKYSASDKGRAASKKSKDAHKVEIAERDAEYRVENRDEIRAKDRKRNATLQSRFQKMICKFGVKDIDGSFSTKMQKLGFVDTEDIRAFFRRQFQPGMTFDNHGRQRIGGPRMWHIGHMIVPQYAYDADLEEEQLRCFHKSNLAPQWADENWRQGTALASDDVLLQHKHLWPASWKNKLPSAQLRADIQGRRLDREANAYDSDSGDDSDFDSDSDFDDSDDEAGPSGVQTMPQDSDSD